MSAAKTSLMAAGRSPAAPSHAVGCSNAIGASQMPLVDYNDAGDCDPCLRTIL
jgi:hypothetical protein